MKSDILYPPDYKAGELVRIKGICSNYYPRQEKEGIGYIHNIHDSRLSIIEIVTKIDSRGYLHVCSFESVSKIERAGCIMNEIIVEMFPKTKDAVLVDKWFGREIDKPIFKMLIKGKEAELIAESKKMEEQSN